MNRVLLVWNLIVTLALAAVVLSGCASMDPQFTTLQTQVNQNRALIEQVINLSQSNSGAVNSLTTEVTKNTLNIANMQTTTQAALTAQKNSLEQYIQQFVQAYVSEAIQ